MSFKNIVSGSYRVSEEISVLSLVRYNDRSVFILETVSEGQIVLRTIELQMKVNTSVATLAFQLISLDLLKKFPKEARCQTWNLIGETVIELEGLIQEQQKFTINCQDVEGRAHYTSRSWDNPKTPRTSLECMTEWLAHCGIMVDDRWESFKCDLTSQAFVVTPSQAVDSTSSPSLGFFNYQPKTKADAQSFLKLGQKHFGLKNYLRALHSFDQAWVLDPSNEEVKQGKAMALFECGVNSYNEACYAEAETYFSTLLTLFPDHLAAQEGRLLSQNKLRPQARTPVGSSKKFRYPIENLVFQGGGIKGLAYAGNLEELLSGDYEFSLDTIKRVGGTSAGALTALILGLGYTLEEIKSILIETDFTKFFEGPYRETFLGLNSKSEDLAAKFKQTTQGSKLTVASGAAALYSSDPDVAHIKEGISLLQEQGFGLFSGDALREWIEEKIRLKTGGIKNAEGRIEGGIECATFRELHDLKQQEPDKYKDFKDLSVVAVNYTLNTVEVFSYEHTPDVVVGDAVSASASIPLVFKARQIFIKTAETKLRPVPDSKGHIYIDGGVLSNLPTWLFDDKRYLPDGQDMGYEVNPHTLAFMLVNPAKKVSQEANTRLEQAMPEGVFGYIKGLVECIFSNREREIPTIDDRHRTVFIDNKGIKTTEFNLTPFKRDCLLLSGRSSIHDYFERLSREQVVKKSYVHPDYFAYLNLSECDAFGNTLLHTAVLKGELDLVHYLCTKKLEDINRSSKNNENQTVLDLARVLHHPDQEEIVRLLETHHFVETRMVTAPTF